MNTLNVTEAAKYLRLSVKTLQRLDREGKLKSYRTETNRRYYYLEQLDGFLHRDIQQKTKVNIVYCRVSSSNQKPDLKNQRKSLEEFCVARGIENPEYVEEIGGGLNFKRKQFNSILERVEGFEVDKLIIAHKDRWCRFGFDWFESFCSRHGCKILILNQESLSPEQEMVTDLMTIIHCFSSRLYGLRNYKKTLKEALRSGSKS